MQYLGWLIKVVIFVLLLGFALRNSEVVTVRYYLDYVWEAPLVLILLGFFAMGAATGLLAIMPHLIRQRRELGRLRKAATRPPEPKSLVPENS